MNSQTPQTTRLSDRAHAAAAYLRLAPEQSPYGPFRGADHARTRLRLAAALGIGLDRIETQPDGIRRRIFPGEPIIATVKCPASGDTYTFLARNPLYDDEPFELLGPCPECGGEVPLADIRHLADLGTYLARAPFTTRDTDRPDSFPETFQEDAGHTTDCRHGGIR
ncbi:hypothetical protein [Streptomyces chilikensis]|uniref:hypothetical protein n=1 Tax=Streptomyces chilikensis TaxID=1194079 RepID=UPI0014087F88|nr:hypothetical protein [Streptomyces chilikensis]